MSKTNNTFGWVQLGTTDPNKAKTFYEQLFHWNITPQSVTGHQSYMQIDTGNGPAAGISKGDTTESHWVPFVSVDDIQAYTAKAKSLGAEIIVPITDLGKDQGFICVFRDPTRAGLGIHSFQSTTGSSGSKQY
jgi:predicted enzyme related to lactoylglutathione lyase